MASGNKIEIVIEENKKKKEDLPIRDSSVSKKKKPIQRKLSISPYDLRRITHKNIVRKAKIRKSMYEDLEKKMVSSSIKGKYHIRMNSSKIDNELLKELSNAMYDIKLYRPRTLIGRFLASIRLCFTSAYDILISWDRKIQIIEKHMEANGELIKDIKECKKVSKNMKNEELDLFFCIYIIMPI